MKEILNNLKPLYLNSSDYSGKDWKLKEDCSVFSNRKLCKYEIVVDFDNVSHDQKTQILTWFIKHNFLFVIYTSSETGLHLHFFSKYKNKFHKRKLLELIEQDLKIPIDSGPVMRGWIRAEDSVHPVKKTIKTLLYTNISKLAYLSPLFYTNELSYSTHKKVLSQSILGDEIILSPETETPKSIRYMLSHKFTDGRSRIIFCLMSYWKDKGLDNNKIFENTKEWLRKQNYYIQDHKIWASIYSNKARVRDNYRLNLLNELGVDIKTKDL